MSPISVDRSGAVAWCRLERPPLNLLDLDLIRAIRETFSALAPDPSVRAAVLTASGRAFTAGMEVRVLRDLDAHGARALITDLHDAIETVHRAPFPVIAALNGHCLGAGLELALACDLRVSVDGALLGLPEVRVGIPSVIHAALLPGLVGPGRAAQMLLSGESIPAELALRWGLVNRVVEPAALRSAAEEILGGILAAGPRAVRLQKELIIAWRSSDLAAAMRAGIAAFASAYTGDEPREGASAFLERRPPRWS
jgi:enoyl-CoA hydratase/carnithine racemase